MRVVWKFVTLTMLALLAISCGGSDTDATDTGAVTLPGNEEAIEETTTVVETTTVAETTVSETTVAAESAESDAETSAAESGEEETTTSVEETETESTEAPDTTSSDETTEGSENVAEQADGPAGSLGLKIVSVNFDTAEVQIMNSGSVAVDISDYTWCNFPEYVGVSNGGVIEPGATLTLASTVAMAPETGELGLYRTSDFGDSNAIAAYVEWGSPDHQRAPVAIAAGIWNGEPLTVDGNTITN